MPVGAGAGGGATSTGAFEMSGANDGATGALA
jgi:hypothetical protein